MKQNSSTDWPFFLAMTILCGIGLIFLAFIHPSSSAFIPKCPFLLATGLYCPGCGSMRATHYLLQGDWAASFRHHPLLIPVLVALLYLYVKRLWEVCSRKMILLRGELPFFVALLAVIVLFFVLRNIPLDSLDWTRPPCPAELGFVCPDGSTGTALTASVRDRPPVFLPSRFRFPACASERGGEARTSYATCQSPSWKRPVHPGPTPVLSWR